MCFLSLWFGITPHPHSIFGDYFILVLLSIPFYIVVKIREDIYNLRELGCTIPMDGLSEIWSKVFQISTKQNWECHPMESHLSLCNHVWPSKKSEPGTPKSIRFLYHMKTGTLLFDNDLPKYFLQTALPWWTKQMTPSVSSSLLTLQMAVAALTAVASLDGGGGGGFGAFDSREKKTRILR